MEIKTVGVLGAGTMGNGIAHVFAKSGFHFRKREYRGFLVILQLARRFFPIRTLKFALSRVSMAFATLTVSDV